MKSIKQQINAVRIAANDACIKKRPIRQPYHRTLLRNAEATLASIALTLGNPKRLRTLIVSAIETQPTVELTADAILDILGVRVPSKPKTHIIIKGKRREVRIKHIGKTGVTYELK